MWIRCELFATNRSASNKANFKDSKAKAVTHYGEAGPLPKGTVMTVIFELEGHEFLALNRPEFKFTEAISFMVNCETQKEVDEHWDKLLAGGGKESVCGWLKDKYGLSWQVVPTVQGKLHEGTIP